MLAVLLAVIGGGAVIAWVVAVYSYIQLVRHRKPDVSLISLFTNGLDAFSSAKFLEGGKPHQTRLLWSAAAFFVCVLLAIGVSALGTIGG